MKPGVARLILGFSMFVMGICGIVYEYVLSVLGNYLVGSSHEEMFVVIGVMMFAMGTGTIFQRGLRRDLLDAFLTLEVLLGLVGGFAGVIIYVIFSYSDVYRPVLYLFAYVIGALVGMEIPVLIRINKEHAPTLKTNLADILSMDYIGSLAGALLFVYVLLTRVSLARIGFVLGLANVAVSLLGFLAFHRGLTRPRTVLGVALAALVALSLGFVYADDWAEAAEEHFLQAPVAYAQDTRYQHLVLTKRKGLVKLFINNHIQFSSADEQIYHDFLVHPAMALAQSRRRVLILGGGDGLALREVLRYPDVERVSLVDIDDAMLRLAATQPDLVHLNEGAFTGATLRIGGRDAAPAPLVPKAAGAATPDVARHGGAQVDVFAMDADLFVRSATQAFDVVLLDFPDPRSVELAKLYSQGFYQAVKRVMASGAVASVQSTSPFYAKQAFLCIGATLRAAELAVVPYHHNVPTFNEWGFHLFSTGRSESQLLADMRGLTTLPVQPGYVTAPLIVASTYFGQGGLEHEPPVEPSSRMNPVVLAYYRRAWQEY